MDVGVGSIFKVRLVFRVMCSNILHDYHFARGLLRLPFNLTTSELTDNDWLCLAPGLMDEIGNQEARGHDESCEKYTKDEREHIRVVIDVNYSYWLFFVNF